MKQPRTPSIQAHGQAAPGLLARLAVVLNPHPVTEFEFLESPDGTITLTIRLNPDAGARTDWHVQRVAARLRRVIGVMSVETANQARGYAQDRGSPSNPKGTVDSTV